MHPRDECKTVFMTKMSCYCYTVMPFELKNAGATYQRLIDKVLAPMIGRNVACSGWKQVNSWVSYSPSVG